MVHLGEFCACLLPPSEPITMIFYSRIKCVSPKTLGVPLANSWTLSLHRLEVNFTEIMVYPTRTISFIRKWEKNPTCTHLFGTIRLLILKKNPTYTFINFCTFTWPTYTFILLLIFSLAHICYCLILGLTNAQVCSLKVNCPIDFYINRQIFLPILLFRPIRFLVFQKISHLYFYSVLYFN